MVRAGLLRNRVTIQEHGTGEDAVGQPIDEWTDVANVWAQIQDIRGREFIEAQQIPGGEITTQVRMRYRGDITRQHRIVSDTRTLEVVSVIEPTGRGEELRLMCREAT